MTSDLGSTVPRRRLGRALRALREQNGLRAEDAGAAVELSRAFMYRIEKGVIPARVVDVQALCKVYGASDELTEQLSALAKETKDPAWWNSYGDVIPDWLNDFLGLEAIANRLRQYESELVPGLLQTPRYAESLFRKGGGDDESAIARRVTARLNRQQSLTRSEPLPPEYEVVISETVLRRVVGTPEVMVEQLSRLNALSDAFSNLTVRVLPFSAGAHRGAMAGSSVIMRFPDNDDPDTVFVEGLTGGLYLRKPKELARYEEVFADIFSRALDKNDSKELIVQVAKEYGRA